MAARGRRRQAHCSSSTAGRPKSALRCSILSVIPGSLPYLPGPSHHSPRRRRGVAEPQPHCARMRRGPAAPRAHARQSRLYTSRWWCRGATAATRLFFLYGLTSHPECSSTLHHAEFTCLRSRVQGVILGALPPGSPHLTCPPPPHCSRIHPPSLRPSRIVIHEPLLLTLGLPLG